MRKSFTLSLKFRILLGRYDDLWGVIAYAVTQLGGGQGVDHDRPDKHEIP